MAGVVFFLGLVVAIGGAYSHLWMEHHWFKDDKTNLTTEDNKPLPGLRAAPIIDSTITSRIDTSKIK